MQRKLITTRGRPRSQTQHKVLLLTLLVLPAMTVLADIYKWVDKDGKLHYGDKPPTQVEGERLQVEPADLPKQPDEGELRRQRLLEQADEQAQRRIESRQARSAAQRAEAEARLTQEQDCFEARKQLAVLQEQAPVYRDEEGQVRATWKYDTYQGEREYIDDATRPSEIERARQKIATLCRHPDDPEEQDLAREQWIRSEQCAHARSQLEARERPSARTTRSELEATRRGVERHCD